jgi:hypothetical protein
MSASVSVSRKILRALFPDRAPYRSTSSPDSDLVHLRALVRALEPRFTRLLKPRSAADRVAYALGRFSWPVSLLARAFLEVCHCGASIRAEESVAIMRQLGAMSRNGLRLGLPPRSFYRFRLWRAVDPRLFISDHDLSYILRAWRTLQGATLASRLDNKAAFADFCAAEGLPHVPVLAHFRAGRLVHPSERFLSLPHQDIVCKRTDCAAGEGFQMWLYSSQHGSFIAPTGEVLSSSEVLARIARDSDNGPRIVQVRIHNHPELRPLAGSGTSTLRILTVCQSTEAPQVVRASLRIPRNGQYTDNIGQGGLAAPVNAKTGYLGSAILKDSRSGVFPRHPDTGVSIAGQLVPDFADACDLARAAHRLVSAVPAVGWDICITKQGPVLIEANTLWDAGLVQAPQGEPLGGTIVTRVLSESVPSLSQIVQAIGN